MFPGDQELDALFERSRGVLAGHGRDVRTGVGDLQVVLSGATSSLILAERQHVEMRLPPT